MKKLNIGDRVWYAPSLNGPRFAAVVASDPWKLGEHTWVVRLEDLGQDYQEYTHKHGRSVVADAAVNNVFREPVARKPRMTKLEKAERFAHLWRRGQREDIWPRESFGDTQGWLADQTVLMLEEIERLRTALEIQSQARALENKDA